MAAVWGWTVVPLALLHLLWWRRRPELLRFQLVLDLVLAVVVGPALATGAQLDPVRTLERNPPFEHWQWSGTTQYQPTHSDLVLQIHPWLAEARRHLLRGELPLISDRIGGGLPLLAAGQAGVWAPVNLPVWALGPERGTTVMVLWKLELAALGAFLFLRRAWRLRWAAAASGALVFAAGAYLMAWVIVPMGWVIAALPWAWWGTTAALAGRLRVARVLGVAVGLGWLMGSGLNPETAVIVVGSALLAGVLLHPRRWRRVLALGVVAAALTTLLAWPTLAYIRSSSKVAVLAAAEPNRTPPPLALRLQALEQAAVPMALGHPGRGDWSAPFPYSAAAVAVGGLGLGLLALGRVSRRRRRHLLAVLATLAVGAVLLYRVPPLDMVLVRLPLLSVMTLPRFAVLVFWGLAAWVGLAADAAMAGRRRSGWWVAAAAAVTAAVAGAAVVRGLAPVDGALALLTPVAVLAALPLLGRPVLLAPAVALELALYAVGINPLAAPADLVPQPPLVRRLTALARQEGGRVVGLGGMLPANLAARYGLGDLRAYDPVRPRPYVRLLAALGDPDPVLGGPLGSAPPGLLGAWSVRWLVTPAGLHPPGWVPVWRDSSGAIWRNPSWLPEVRVVGRTERAGEDAGWELLAADRLDLGVEAVVPADGPRGAADSARLQALEATDTAVRAQVRCDGPCLLVVARPWAPGWHAAVDGAGAEVVRANLAGLGVASPAGEHLVELAYNPWRW